VNQIKKYLWMGLGFISLGMAYIGVITPGLPYSIFVVFAAYCFSKGNERMHNWIMNHKLFGPFLRNWGERRVFPTKMKFFMVFMMSTSLCIMLFTGVKPIGIISTAIFMACVAVWAWRFPGSVEEHQRRKTNNKRIGWLK
jgi:uncharacterized protein|tara:strand:- start:551 stop:970 length:420 start_codon:yes stop_codon:yes gene_type:complete